jgi:glycerol uptake facilitator-like aquaporin
VTPLSRRLTAEFAGTCFLVAIVVGSGTAAASLTADAALRLLASSLVTGTGLAVLIAVFAPAGGAQLNPVVTVADWLLARRTPRRYGARQAAAVITAQIAGAIAGTALSDAMFRKAILTPSATHRAGLALLLSETVATAGLLLVIVTLARTSRTQQAPWAVGAWIGAAYWFTASTAFANPAVTIGRTLTNTYAGIAPSSAPAFIAAQITGGALGTLLAVTIHPLPAAPAGPAGTQAQLTG